MFKSSQYHNLSLHGSHLSPYCQFCVFFSCLSTWQKKQTPEERVGVNLGQSQNNDKGYNKPTFQRFYETTFYFSSPCFHSERFDSRGVKLSTIAMTTTACIARLFTGVLILSSHAVSDNTLIITYPRKKNKKKTTRFVMKSQHDHVTAVCMKAVSQSAW